MREKQIEFLKKFSDINVKQICDELGINSKNVYSGKTKIDNMILINGLIQYRIEKLLLDEKYDCILSEYNKRKIEILEDK